jgi:pyruvate dehydrogenase E2 component (dihydrolipoamide acetyltransferase)
MREFRMPSLGADMQAGTLVKWRSREGQSVRHGDIIAEVETDKGVIEVEVFDDGVIERLLVPAGTKVPVGTPLALIRSADEAARPAASATPAAALPAVSPAPTAPAPMVAPSSTQVGHEAGERLRISPAARRRARELGVDPQKLVAAGSSERISLADIEAAARAAPVQPVPSPPGGAQPAAAGAAATAGATESPQDRMRRAIGAAMARSKREIPHYYLTHTIDFSAASRWLESYNATRAVEQRILSAALFIRALALALHDVPELNALWTGEQAPPIEQVNMAVAISLRGGGLIAPALQDVGHKSLPEVMDKLKDLVRRARSGGLRSSELRDSTITLTNLGDRGVEGILPVIFPPQVAIVGVGAIVERPWVVAGQLVVCPTVKLSLAADHRVSDGHRGAALLLAFADHLAHPEGL